MCTDRIPSNHEIQNMGQLSFPPRLNCIAVLACNYFYLLSTNNFGGFHLELWVFDNERPYIIAKSVGVEVALRTYWTSGNILKSI